MLNLTPEQFKSMRDQGLIYQDELGEWWIDWDKFPHPPQTESEERDSYNP